MVHTDNSVAVRSQSFLIFLIILSIAFTPELNFSGEVTQHGLILIPDLCNFIIVVELPVQVYISMPSMMNNNSQLIKILYTQVGGLKNAEKNIKLLNFLHLNLILQLP